MMGVTDKPPLGELLEKFGDWPTPEISGKPPNPCDNCPNRRRPAADSEDPELKRLRRDCGEAYFVVLAALYESNQAYTRADVVRVLNNLAAAVSGEPRPHDDLLPWPQS